MSQHYVFARRESTSINGFQVRECVFLMALGSKDIQELLRLASVDYSSEAQHGCFVSLETLVLSAIWAKALWNCV